MTQSLQELERDVEQSRAKLDLTIDRLQSKMSVSGVVDDLLGTARSGQYEPHFDNVLDTIRRNPVPVMLIVAGIGLLAYRLSRTAPVARRRTQFVAGQDVVPMPEDTRLYGSGASTLPHPDERLEPRAGLNSRI